jgi:hypothetical protein
MDVGRQDFTTCLIVPSPSLTQGETQASSQTRLRALSNR